MAIWLIFILWASSHSIQILSSASVNTYFFHTHSFTYFSCWLLYFCPFALSIITFLCFFHYFFQEAQFNTVSPLVLWNSWIILTKKFLCPSQLEKDTRHRKLKTASSKSEKVWSHKKHALALRSIRKLLLRSAVSTSPLGPSFLVEQRMCLKRQGKRRVMFTW